MLRNKLEITPDRLKRMNDFLLDENNPLVNDLLAVIDKYGGPEEINRKAAEAGSINTLMSKLDAGSLKMELVQEDYGELQGRYYTFETEGDSFLLMKRSSKGPNYSQ